MFTHMRNRMGYLAIFNQFHQKINILIYIHTYILHTRARARARVLKE